MIKSWVYNKTVFYLLKIKGENEPVVLNVRDLKSFSIRKDGSISAEIDYNTFKISRGRSKSYFGNKQAMVESSKDKTFDEYDPLNEASYQEAPDDEMDLLMYDDTIDDPGYGSDPVIDPSDDLPPPGEPVVLPPDIPPPPEGLPRMGGFKE